MGMILRIASSRIVGQGDIVGRSGYFSLNLSANSVMRGRLDARRTLKSLVADLRTTTNYYLSTGINFEYRSRSTLSLGVKYTDQFKVSSGRFQGQKLAFFLNITFSEKTYRAKLK